jgi:hypothetical protein
MPEFRNKTEAFEAIVAWCRRERDTMLSDIQDLTSGKWQLVEGRGTDAKIISDTWVGLLTARLDELNDVVATYERFHAQGS